MTAKTRTTQSPSKKSVPALSIGGVKVADAIEVESPFTQVLEGVAKKKAPVIPSIKV